MEFPVLNRLRNRITEATPPVPASQHCRTYCARRWHSQWRNDGLTKQVIPSMLGMFRNSSVSNSRVTNKNDDSSGV